MSKEKLCGIYCIENKINHKKYIGQSIDIQTRWYAHKNKLNNNSHANCYLQRSWNKYKEDSFNFYILELCDNELLDEREVYYIKYYNTMLNEFGYKLESGGKLNKQFSEDSKKKMSKNRKGKTCGEKHYAWGKHLSKEHVEKIREYASSKHGKQCYQSKPVICLNTMEIFECIQDGAKKYHCDATNISRCCKGHPKYRYCGLLENGTPIQWAFYDKNIKYEYNEISKSHSLPVKQYTLDMELLNIFKSVSEASIKTGINKTSISNVCKGKYEQTHNYIFEYAKSVDN